MFQDPLTAGYEAEDCLRFLPYMCIVQGGSLGYATWTIYTKFSSPVLWRLIWNLALNGQSVLEKMFYDNGHLQVFVATGQGQTTSRVKFHILT